MKCSSTWLARYARGLACSLAVAALGGCSGKSGAEETPGSASTGPFDGPCQDLPAIPRRLWLLSNQQYSNAVRDVLNVPTGPTDITGGSTSDYAFFSKDDVRVDAPLANSYASAAAAFAAQIAPQIPSLAACTAGEAPADCAQRFIQSFARRAYRRPLDDGEVTNLMAVYTAGSQPQDPTAPADFAGGLQLVIEAMLQAPSFVYRSELGSGDGATVSLTPYEVATQLAFLFLNSVPDQALIDAAESGRLATQDGIAEQVDRLLALPRAQENVNRIVLDWFGTRQLKLNPKDMTMFPGFNDMMDDVIHSAELFIGDVLWSGSGHISDLLLSPRVFVNQSMADLYGFPFTGASPTDFVAVEAPAGQRFGMLTQPGMIAAASNATTTSVVHRGLFIRSEVICAAPTPEPPPGLLQQPNVVAALDAAPTERDKVELRKTFPGCGGCHGGIDGYGMLLENYDPIGRFRTMTEDGSPVDPSSTLALSPHVTGTVPGPQAFAQGIVEDDVFSTCASRKLTSYAIGWDLGLGVLLAGQSSPIATGNTCAVRDINQRTEQAGGSINALLREIAMAGFMRTRAGGQQ
jgi:hypothetical protein